MEAYIIFFIKCLKSKFKFFKLSPSKQATILEKHQLFFEAGLLYMDLKDYVKAAECFKDCKAYRHCMKAYEKLGSFSNAIEIADKQGYYAEGALLCEKIGNLKKAAYFYAHYKPFYATRLYKTQELFFEAGECYLKLYQFISALECFLKCPAGEQKSKGLKQIEEIAITLYFTKSYELAFKLFLKLGDYYSALECAKKLKYPELIESMSKLLAIYECSLGHYTLAAKYIEPYNQNKALLYYYLSENNKEAIRVLISQKDYDKALNICQHHDYLDLAEQISKLCA